MAYHTIPFVPRDVKNHVPDHASVPDGMQAYNNSSQTASFFFPQGQTRIYSRSDCRTLVISLALTNGINNFLYF